MVKNRHPAAEATTELRVLPSRPESPRPEPDRREPDRRNAIVAALRAETGIDEAMIEHLVRSFYAEVRADPLLGPVFAARIRDWEPHLQRMMVFWSSVALMSGRYHGQPMQVHAPLPIHADHFDRWLEIFKATALRVCPPKAAAHFLERAQRIAESLELGIAGQNGVMLGRGERYRPNVS
ncbi:MAG TPA: group III truncated hemoglobin [Dongiaceae bacterium]|nr:group III truncated hemoglobin [Dongiaceae bacterium]